MTAAGFDPFGRQLFVDGAYRESQSTEAIEVRNPATLEVEGEIAVATDGEVDEAIERAGAAQRTWGGRDATDRAAVLHEVADALADPDPGLAELLSREHGKPYPEATGEIANVAGVFRYYAELARHDAGTQPGATAPASHQFARTFPYGVSVHVVPSNYPILLACWTVAASLAAGNAAIVKPSEETSLSTLRFLSNLGALPDGLVSCVTGDGGVAQRLIRSPGTDVVAFTGGVETAREVYAACASGLKPCVIEAGGNDPLIVTENAPLEVAIAGSATAAFHLSGQVCTCAERLYVHEAVYEEFVDGLVEFAEGLRVGEGLGESEIGPLVSERARDRVATLVEDAVESGATLACGGPSDREVGWFYEPTVLTDVDDGMAVMREEVFGPVAPVRRVSTLEEAIELANDSRFGLGASVFTTDLAEAMGAYERLEAGMVWINDPMIDNDAIPFGGWKDSGVGRELGRPGLDAFRRTKMGVVDWDPGVKGWWYPYPEEWFYDTEGGRF